ncbi:MAG: peptidoglycan DD-metalloendopeptidase family protein [Anaerolineae bacterium]|nr:peptidoglycan DD-metalloendopeptidase family protein [Anaerolineae bacterium]
MSYDIHDTNPSKPKDLEARLRAEEPPIMAEDTNPSIITRQALLEQPAARHLQSSKGKSRGNLQRVVVLFVLLGAVILTGVEAYLWLQSEADTDKSKTVAAEESPVEAEVINVPAETDASSEADPKPSELPGETDHQDVQDAPITDTQDTDPPQIQNTNPAPALDQQSTTAITPQPTAAADEIAAALLADPAVDPPANVIVRNTAPFTFRTATQRTEIIQYTIQSGDTLDSIAAKFDLKDIYTLIWSNARNKYTKLNPGTQLTILPEDGVYHEVSEPTTIAALAEKYGVTPYDIIDADYNNLFGSMPETLIPAGLWIAIPGGEGERINFFTPVVGTTSSGSSSSSGASGGGGSVIGQYNLWGCTSNITGGSPPALRPLQYYKFMQGFSLGGHEAVDLSGNVGDPVFASGAGTVAYAGWNNTGYGNVVVIGHGSYFSLYAHLNSYSVSCGQSVSAGSVIGTLGNTGNSTGPHLHFEIRDANWGAISPMYIGF